MRFREFGSDGFSFDRKGVKEMIIEKILNNNVIVSKDKHGDEVIAMGKGIAYQKKVGQKISDKKVNKLYKLYDATLSAKFQELLADIPMEHLLVANDIITYIQNEVNKKLNDSLYLAITDHVSTAIQRTKHGIVVKNALLWDIRRFYKDEYQIGLKVLDIIESSCGVRLSEDEAGFIALHIVNAQLDNSSDDIYEITKLIQDICNIVKYDFHIDFDEDSVYYYRFITHLKFFGQRIFDKKHDNTADYDELYEVVREKFSNAFRCVTKITLFLEKNYSYQTSMEEQVYLAIHIARIVQKSE